MGKSYAVQLADSPPMKSRLMSEMYTPAKTRLQTTKSLVQLFGNIPSVAVTCIHEFADQIPRIEWSIKRREDTLVTNTCALDNFLFGLAVITMHKGGMSKH